MNFSTRIALRYLKASRENRYFSWISTLSILGVAIGVAVMIVVLSVINSFEKELRDRFLAANAHVLAYRYPHGMEDYDLFADDIKRRFESVMTGVAPFVHSDTMGRSKYLIHAMLVKGIHPELRKSVQDVSKIVRPKSSLKLIQDEIDQFELTGVLPTNPSIILGDGLRSILDVEIGDMIEIVSPSQAGDNPFGELQSFQVAGVYDSGLQHYDNKLGIISIPAAQRLFNMGKLVTGIEMGLKDPDRSIEIADRMASMYNLSVKEWRSYNRNIFEAMETERTVIGLIVFLVAFVASFNILTTLFVSVSQKQKDISLLKALGATSQTILKIFFKQSLMMGVLGGAIGIVLALILSYILMNYPFIKLPDIYLLATLPISIEWKVYLTVFCGGVLTASIAGIYPAWVAARTIPTEGLSLRQRD